MRAIELTARTFPLSIPSTSLITCVLVPAPPHCFRTNGTFWLCASSTLRKCKTLAPQKHISDSEAKSSRRNGFAFATIRGSAEHTPSTSLMISQLPAFSAAALFQNQRHVLALRQLDAAKMQN